MVNFDPHLNIDPIMNTKDSEYNIKEIEIEHPKFNITTPFKVLDGNEINKETAEHITHGMNNPLFESGKVVNQVQSLNRLHYLLEEAEYDKIGGLNKFFGLRQGLLDSNLTTTSLVFARNPLVENKFPKSIISPLSESAYISLLDYVHSASSAFVLAPDIRIKKEEIISIDDYLKFIDFSIKILSDFNNKPIFAPIQIQLNPKRLDRILEHYRINGYTNLWINFNSSHLGSTYFARVRTLLRSIDKYFGLSNVALYFSHIKKEFNPNIKDNETIASDAISQFFGADFVGVNMEPWRYVPNSEEKLNLRIAQGEFTNEEDFQRYQQFHKSRIFDPESYYYYSINSYPRNLPFRQDELFKKELNRLINSKIIHLEVENTKNVVESEKRLGTYLKDKTVFRNNKNLYDNIIGISKQVGILNFL